MQLSERFPFPTDLHYDPTDHMWARRDDQGRIVVGIDVLGLENLGDLAYVTLHDPGTAVRRGEAMGTLEAAKMTGDIRSPVSGRVVARNDGAVENPALVNTDCYGAGWLLAIEPEDWSADATALVTGDAVAGWVAAEVARFREEGWLD